MNAYPNGNNYQTQVDASFSQRLSATNTALPVSVLQGDALRRKAGDFRRNLEK